ncbi:MAG: serine hydrolase [Bacteroidota bacterium]
MASSSRLVPFLGLPLLVAALVACASAPPARDASPPWPEERPDASLQTAIEAVVDGFGGRVGVYVRHLPTGRTAALDADSLFPTASTIKVPILVATLDAVERGALSWDEPLVFRDSLRYDDYGLVGLLQDSARVAVHRLAEEMLSASDNNASLWLQALSGGGARINELFAAQGYTGTRMNSRTPGRRGDWQRYGWGQTTPREMARLMREIVDRDVDVISPAADEEMHRALTRTFYDDEIVSAVPPEVQVASKQGAVSDSRSEVAYVHAPSGPYVIAVFTDGQTDTSWEPGNAGWELIREVAGIAWRAFEPASDWRPAPGGDRFRLGE